MTVTKRKCTQGVVNIAPPSDVVTAMQYLMWALEYIEKTGDHKAAHHARLALEALRERASSRPS
jgi:hypothetical protein